MWQVGRGQPKTHSSVILGAFSGKAWSHSEETLVIVLHDVSGPLFEIIAEISGMVTL